MIKIYVSQSPAFASLDIYIVDRNELTGKTAIFNFDKDQMIGRVLEDYAALTEPTIRLLPEYANELIKAFAELAAERGLKTTDDKVREGKVEAMEKHLEDMRSLVFKGKQNGR